MEDLVEKVDSTSEATEEQVEATEVVETTTEEETEQDPLKIELEKVQKKSKYSEEEKAEFTFKKQAERLKELGKDPASILGIKETSEEEDEDDKPVTKAELKKLLAGNATKSAIDLAEEIPNPTEKELVKYYLENTIKPSGDAQEDLRNARRMVNAVKNEQIITEVSRKTPPKTHSNSSGVDAKKEVEFIPTPEEQVFMKAPFHLNQSQILEMRAGKKFTFKK